MKILLVDDDNDILEAVQMSLQSEGYEVLLAHDGAEALVCVERDAPDLIVLDLVMPRRTGWAVVDRIHASPCPAPRIILVSGNDEPRHREYAAEHGVDYFLAKPFEIDELLEQIRRLLS